MEKERRFILEMAVSAYRLESASDVFEQISKKRTEDLKNSTNMDYLTLLPIKCIDENIFIQIVGTECPDVFFILKFEPNLNDRIAMLYRPYEVDKFIREMKVREIL